MVRVKKPPFELCPSCGAALTQRTVEKTIHGGNRVAVVRVEADVCPQCGERLYSLESIMRFEQVARKLEEQ